MENREKQIHDVIAAEEIRHKIYTYCRACDRNDVELGASIFTDDSVYNCGETFTGSGREYFEWCVPINANYFAATNHSVSNVVIRVDDDTAVSEAYVHAYNVYIPQADPEGRYIVADDRGRYLDQWKCVDGNWLIAKRQYIQEMHSQYPVPDFKAGSGLRDKNDPSYELFK